MPRPRTFDDEVATRKIECRITAHELHEWRAVAKETGQTLTSLVRVSINAYVADYGEARVFRPRPRS